MFEQDVDPVQVAQLLRVSAKSAYQWRRRWRADGEAAVVMPPTVSRPYPVDLLLCGHHYWVSRPRCGPRAPPSTTTTGVPITAGTSDYQHSRHQP